MTLKDAENPSNILWQVKDWDVANDEERAV